MVLSMSLLGAMLHTPATTEALSLVIQQECAKSMACGMVPAQCVKVIEELLFFFQSPGRISKMFSAMKYSPFEYIPVSMTM